MDYEVMAGIGILLILGGYVAFMVWAIKHALKGLWDFVDKK